MTDSDLTPDTLARVQHWLADRLDPRTFAVDRANTVEAVIIRTPSNTVAVGIAASRPANNTYSIDVLTDRGRLLHEVTVTSPHWLLAAQTALALAPLFADA